MLSCWWTRFLVSFTWLIIGFQAEALAAQPRIFEPYDGLPDTYLGHYVSILAGDKEPASLDDVVRQRGRCCSATPRCLA